MPAVARQSLERRINGGKFGVGYLEEKGWFEGAGSHRSVGSNGEPVPWITYPAREMLDRIVRPSARVFEYGTGNSSLWWAKKASQVVAVEHDPAWIDEIRKRAPSNLDIAFRPRGEAVADDHRPLVESFLKSHPDLPTTGDSVADVVHGLSCADFGAYAAEPAKYGKGFFDILVVDGMARSLCAHVASEMAAEDGFILFDNSERWQYNPGFEVLGERGWKRIDFYGPGPVMPHAWCTSIFCRTLDWLPSDTTIPPPRRADLR